MLNIVGYSFFLLFLMLIIKNNFKVVNNFIVIKYLNLSYFFFKFVRATSGLIQHYCARDQMMSRIDTTRMYCSIIILNLCRIFLLIPFYHLTSAYTI